MDTFTLFGCRGWEGEEEEEGASASALQIKSTLTGRSYHFMNNMYTEYICAQYHHICFGDFKDVVKHVIIIIILTYKRMEYA